MNKKYIKEFLDKYKLKGRSVLKSKFILKNVKM